MSDASDSDADMTNTVARSRGPGPRFVQPPAQPDEPSDEYDFAENPAPREKSVRSAGRREAPKQAK